MSLEWYAIVVKAGLSRLAETCLWQQAFENFFPRVASDQGKMVDLLPGYGFVRFDEIADKPWEPINSTRGVKHLLPLGHEQPSKIPGTFVERVRELIRVPDVVPAVPEHDPVYFKNDVVNIVSGPMAGNVGRYQMRRNRGWAEVIVSPFGIEMKTVVKFHQIKLKGRVAIAA